MKKTGKYFIINRRHEIFQNYPTIDIDENGSIIIKKREQPIYQIKKNISLYSLDFLDIVNDSFVIDKCNILYIIDKFERKNTNEKRILKIYLDNNRYESIPYKFINPISVCVNKKNIYVLDKCDKDNNTIFYRIFFISKYNYQIIKVIESSDKKDLFRILYNDNNESLILLEWKEKERIINISEISVNTGQPLQNQNQTETKEGKSTTTKTTKSISLYNDLRDIKLHTNLKLTNTIVNSTFDFLYILDAPKEDNNKKDNKQLNSWIQIYDLKKKELYNKLKLDDINKNKYSLFSSLDTDSEGNIYVVYEKSPDETNYAFAIKIPVSAYIKKEQNFVNPFDSVEYIKNYLGQSDSIFIDKINSSSNDIYLINFEKKYLNNHSYTVLKNIIILTTKYPYGSKSEIGPFFIDSLEENSKWSKISLEYILEDKTAIEIFYYASNKGILEISENDKDWSHIQINTKNAKDFPLLYPSIGRYLYIKISLVSLDPNNTPRLKELKVNYSDDSYLKYLPQIYQENEISKRFLENFLALFKIMFENIDLKISSTTKYLDAASVPDNFLPWLASWISLSYDESWNPHNIRIFLEKAPELYKMRGTKEGIIAIILIYLDNHLQNTPEKSNNKSLTCQGRSKFIDNKLHSYISFHDVHKRESPVWIFERNNPLILSNSNFKEISMRGSDEHPFTFYVVLNPVLVKNSKIEGIKKIVEREKPAHTISKICKLNPWFYLGFNTYMGINSIVGKRNKMIVGVSKLGVDFILDTNDDRGQIEKRNRINIDTVLS